MMVMSLIHQQRYVIFCNYRQKKNKLFFHPYVHISFFAYICGLNATLIY